MAVTLVTPQDAPRDGFDVWCAIRRAPDGLDSARRIEGLGKLLENALDSIRDEWFDLAHVLGVDASATYAHTPSCAANTSDFGLMLAWTRLVDAWAAEARSVLIVCEDPWLFRHLAARPGVRAGRRPPLGPAEFRLRLRGILARAFVAARAFLATLRFRRQGEVLPGGAWILVYSHPASRADGFDTYFGDLVCDEPSLRRVLHVDGPLARAEGLCRSGRTFSLHAFGSPFAALGLWRARWRPPATGANAWLIRRAAALEGGTGQAAMIAWQIHCQERWLKAVRPSVVVWPWENHSWERALVRAARRHGVRTIGYQHATVARYEWNYSARSNPDGLNSIPDRIFCSGEVHRARLATWGVPEERMTVAGSLRFVTSLSPRYDPQAPVFVALPFDAQIANEMLEALCPLAATGWRFLVRDHPMSPVAFAHSPGIAQAEAPLSAQRGVAAVLYCATTVGLEAVLAGLPTLRFRPRCRVPTDPMPEGIEVPAASSDEIEEQLKSLQPSSAISKNSVFAPPDLDLWREELTGRHPLSSPSAKPESALMRRLRQLREDSILRRWLIEKLLGRAPRRPHFTPHRPPYLKLSLIVSASPSLSRLDRWRAITEETPTAPLTFRLHGRSFTLSTDSSITLFHGIQGDLETYLGLHRFAWLQWADPEPAWLNALWQAWCADFSQPNADWPWHPYTAAERAINILDVGERVGLPAPLDKTFAILARHGQTILERLEYYGEHATGNHLANNGRGLYRIGLALGIKEYADIGARILIEEAKRLFRPSGMLREGSSHYHFLVTAWYLDCLKAARAHDRPEAVEFETIVSNALSVTPHLMLPGGLPLVGDISPDLPPEMTLQRLANHNAPPGDPWRLAADGWLKAEFGSWSGLWYAAPQGWSPMPGHGHQDTGGFQLHLGDQPVFVDVGRGAYGDHGEAACYRSATVHNGVTVDGHDPFPPNRPYYDDGFRRRVAGSPPELACESNLVRLSHEGFTRLKGVGRADRAWRFTDGGLVIDDQVDGRGRRRIERRLHTPLAVNIDGSTAILNGSRVRVRVQGDVSMRLDPVTIWHAYGEGRPGTALVLACEAELPWQGRIEIEAA